MPKVSWAAELGIDTARLEFERPQDWFQQQLAQLHAGRAEAFAEHSRLVAEGRMFAAEIIAWERYSSLTRTVCDLTGSDLPVGIIAREAERQANVQEAVLKNTCSRCGFVWNAKQPKFIGGLCSSCLALQERVLRTGRLACQPWQGRFASDDVTPISAAGDPILPGLRVCNNSDCVNPKHIKKGNN